MINLEITLLQPEKAETKHWRQQEDIQIQNEQTKNLKLSRYITELSVVVGPIDLVLDLKIIFDLIEMSNLFPKPPKKLQKSKTPMKLPLMHIKFQDNVLFFPVESYDRLDDTFCISLQNLSLSPSPEHPLQ